jgi:5'-3' exonuclease
VEGEYANFVVSVVGRAKRFAEEGVGLHMVFDGAPMPGKSGCKVKRDERRAKSLAFTSSAESKVDQKQYEAALKAAIQITPQMKKAVQRALRLEGFSYEIAPYEADSQLAKLVRRLLISAANAGSS